MVRKRDLGHPFAAKNSENLRLSASKGVTEADVTPLDAEQRRWTQIFSFSKQKTSSTKGMGVLPLARYRNNSLISIISAFRNFGHQEGI